MAKNETESTMKYKVDISNLKSNIQQANRLVKEANSEFKATTSSMDNWAKSTDGLTAKQKQLITTLDAQKTKLEALKEQHRLTAQYEGENSKAAQDLTIKINNQEAAIGKTEKQMRELDKSLIDAYKSGKITASEFNNLANEQTKLAAKTEKTKENLNQLKDVTHDLSNKLKNGLVTGIKASTTALLGMIAASTNVGSSFEAGMSEVQAISGATSEELEQLTNKAKEMGANTKFSASEAAEAFKYMAMAGWKTADMLSGIEGVMNLAAASGEELGLVSDIVTDGLTAFGLSAKDAGHFSDVLATASSNANTNVSMMGESFKEAGALSGTMGYSIDDLALAIGLMANSGIKGSKAGTTLKNAIANMAKPTDAMAALMDKYNLSLSNADGTMKPFIQVVDELRSSFGGLTKDQQASAAATLFGKESMAGMLSVINASETDYNKLRTAIANADGASKQMAETMEDNVKGAATILKSTLEGLGIQIYDTFKADLKDMIKSVTTEFNKLGRELKKPDIKNALSTIAKGFIELIKNATKLISAVLPHLLKGFAFLVDNSKLLIPLLGGLASAMLAYQVKTALAAKTTEGLNTVQLIAKGAALLYNTALGVMNGTIDLQIIKTGVLNALHAATPWGLLITGVGLAIGALINFNSREDESITKIKENTEAIQEELDAFNDMTEARRKNVEESAGEFDYYSRLKDELRSLTDEDGKVKKGYEGRVKFIINELNEALGTEISMTGNVIDKYKEQMKTIDDLIAKQRAKAIIDAGQEAYAEAIKNQTKAVKEYAEAKIAYDEQAQIIEEAIQRLKDKGHRDEYVRQMEVSMWNNIAAKAAKENYETKKELAEEYTETIAQQEYLQKMYAKGSAEDIAAINDYIAKSYDDKGKKVVLSTEEQIKSEEVLLDYMKRRYKETGNEMYKDQINASENRLKTLKEELNNQKSTINEGSKETSTAWENLCNGNIKSFKKDSEEYRVAAFHQTLLAKEGINAGTLETNKAWTELENQGYAKLTEKGWKYTKAGEDYVIGVKKGVENKKGSVWNAIASFGQGMLNSLKDVLDIRSPSREGERIGKMLDEGILKGIEGGKSKITRSLKNLIDMNTLKRNVASVDLNVKGKTTPSSQGASTSKTANLTINQTINSPKILDPLDVHRETKRAIKQMRGYKYV